MEISRSIQSLGTLIKALDDGSNEAIQIAQDTIDEMAQGVYDELKRTTPQDTSGLVGSLTIQSTQNQNSYGKEIFYDGYDKNGQPYQAIANSLNIGRMSYKGQKRKRGRKNHEPAQGARLFINNAQRQLKGLDDKIRENVIGNINDKLNGR